MAIGGFSSRPQLKNLGQGVIPTVDVLWTSNHLRLGGTGTIEANVDGSSTPQEFFIAPAAGKIYFLADLTFSLLDVGSMTDGKFGAGPSLGEPGLEWYVQSKGVYHRVVRVKENLELSNEFPTNQMALTDSGAFLASKNQYRGTLLFPVPIRLDGDQGDFVKMIVNDNLLHIDRMICRAKFFEVNP